MTPQELASIPIASPAFATRRRQQAFKRLAAAQRRLADLANPQSRGQLELDEIHLALDARAHAYATIGEWTEHWRTR